MNGARRTSSSYAQVRENAFAGSEIVFLESEFECWSPVARGLDERLSKGRLVARPGDGRRSS